MDWVPVFLLRSAMVKVAETTDVVPPATATAPPPPAPDAPQVVKPSLWSKFKTKVKENPKKSLVGAAGAGAVGGGILAHLLSGGGRRRESAE